MTSGILGYLMSGVEKKSWESSAAPTASSSRKELFPQWPLGFFKRTNGLSNLFRLLCETATAIGRDIINYIRSVGGERMIQAV